MARLILEVIVQSVADARAATEGGADRLEVVRAIELGGLTPSRAIVRAIAAETGLPLRVMVRENGGYSANAREIEAMRRAAAEFAEDCVNGLVLGFALDGEAVLEDTAAVLEAAPAVPATFHRAFDQLRDPVATIDRLITLPQIDRILTDGGRGPVPVRCQRLRQYSARGGDHLTILAGGGVDAGTVEWFARNECVREVHVGRAAREGNDQGEPVSVERVRHLRSLAS